MKRVSADALQAKAWESGRSIEVDREAGIALVVINRVTFYADLNEVESTC